MPFSPLLKRLMRVRRLQEEYSQAALREAHRSLNDLNEATQRAVTRQAGGRCLFFRGADAPDATDRLAGLLEEQVARAQVQRLTMKARRAEDLVDARLSDLEAAHQECRKSELLLEAAEQKDRAAANRQLQKKLDDNYRHRPKPLF